MKKIQTILLILASIGCNETRIDQKAEGDKIIQLSREWSESASAGNIEKTVSYWAEDATLMAAGQPPLKGKEAIRQMVEESYKIPGFKISWQPQSVVVSESGDMAYLLEDAQVSFNDSTGKQVVHHNKAVTIWRKQSDGSWKNVVDISTPGELNK